MRKAEKVKHKVIERLVNHKMEQAMARVPELEDIKGLRVGVQAPDCFGRLAEVSEVFAKGKDVNGTPFVCYYTRHGSGSVSTSMKVGELIRTVDLTSLLDGEALDILEMEMNGGVIQCRCYAYSATGQHAAACPCTYLARGKGRS